MGICRALHCRVVHVAHIILLPTAITVVYCTALISMQYIYGAIYPLNMVPAPRALMAIWR